MSHIKATKRQPGLFQQRLLTWFATAGRKDLPWQQNPTPYRVWISEIMLQQTQVATVIPYYQRFMSRFADVTQLAKASQDEVLQHWSGLGYYARGRNLLKTANIIVNDYRGQFPTDRECLQQLPGIGRSTAAAILALSANQPQAILDGNVKRVLTRLHAIDGWPGTAAVQQQLWQLAEDYTPTQQAAAYTQAIMDLGATLCTRSKPRCHACPVASLCQAHRLQRTRDYPTSKPRRSLPLRTTTMLVLHNPQAQILLERRPPSGIWGGLWSLPECEAVTDVDICQWAQEQLGCAINITHRADLVHHTFTHFKLAIRPVAAQLIRPTTVMDEAQRVWYNFDQIESRGMATPVKRLLAKLCPTGVSE